MSNAGVVLGKRNPYRNPVLVRIVLSHRNVFMSNQTLPVSL